MYKVLSVLALWLCISTFCFAQGVDTLTQRPRVGLVLSGGGARGAAHVGVIRLLEEMHIPIDYVVGTSMGAIVGALYAVGYTADEMDSLMMTQDWRLLLSNDLPRREQPYAQRMARKLYQVNIPYEKGVLTENSAAYRDAGIKVRRTSLQTFPKVLARPGLIDGKNLMEKFTTLTSAYSDSMSYDALPRSFACVATDLVTGREVVLRSGHLAESIRASMAIPGVFYPIYKGGQVLGDGGVVNNYPVDVARQMGADVVIGVEVNSATIHASDLHSFAAIFERLIGTLGTDLHERNVDDTDILIRPLVKQFPVMGFDATNLRQLIDIGYQTALQSKAQLAVLADKEMEHEDDYPLETEDTTSSVNASEQVLPKHSAPTRGVSLGLRLDTEDGAAALLRIGRNIPNPSGFKYDLTTRISLHPRIAARLAYAKSGMPQVNLAVRYGYARVALPYDRRTAFNYHSCGVDLYLSRFASPDFDLRTGLRYDNYWVRTTKRYASRQAYTTLYVSWRGDLFDTAYTPTRGYAYSLEAAYNVKDKALLGSNFWALQADISAALPLGRTTTLLPSLHVRSLLGESIPQIYANILGGYLPSRYLPQQMSFVGLMGCEQAYPHLVLSRIGLRQRLVPDVYATAWANYAYSREAFTSDSLEQCIWGMGVQLSYDTTLGPLSLCAHWNDLYHRLGAYFSFGFEF